MLELAYNLVNNPFIDIDMSIIHQDYHFNNLSCHAYILTHRYNYECKIQMVIACHIDQHANSNWDPNTEVNVAVAL